MIEEFDWTDHALRRALERKFDRFEIEMTILLGACKANVVWPFAHFNRLQVTPPCVITADEAREGLAGIDKALAVADKYVVG